MLWTNTKRILRSGFVSFWRNGYVSLASVVVMVVTLFVVSSIIFTSATLSAFLNYLEEKVDINVYFVDDALENDILSIKKELEKLPEVAEVGYLSREDTLAQFKDNNKDNEIILLALEEIEDNPLGAVLNIRAKETSQYESIAKYLESRENVSGKAMIWKITYYQSKTVIDNLTNIIQSARKLGAVITAIFVLISILITFNTIRLAIYISRDEIGVMRLVGASSMYIRGPFVVGGIMYGVVAAIITLTMLYPLTYWLGPITERLFVGVNLFQYYLSNFGQIFVILVLSGAGIGAISSYLAVRKYLAK